MARRLPADSTESENVGTRSSITVLQVATDSFSAFEFIAPLIAAAEKDGVRCVLACSGKSYADAHSFMPALEDLGIPVFDVPFSRSMFSFFDDARAIVHLRRLVRTHRPDVVHTHLGKAGIIGRVVAVASRVPSVHTVYDFAFYEERGLRRVALLALERLAARPTRRIFFKSENELAIASANAIGTTRKRLMVGDGIRLDQFDMTNVSTEAVSGVRERFGVPPDRTVIGTVARLVPRKGVETLLAAAQIVMRTSPSVHVLVAGGGPLEQALIAQAQQLGIGDRVSFTGFVENQAEMPPLYAAMDVFCLPTRREGYGMAIMEAGAMGKPVVVSDIAPVNRNVVHGTTGFLAPRDDPESFAAALTKLVQDPALRLRMGRAGNEHAVRRANLFDTFPPVLAAYRDVAAADTAGFGHRRTTVPGRRWSRR